MVFTFLSWSQERGLLALLLLLVLLFQLMDLIPQLGGPLKVFRMNGLLHLHPQSIHPVSYTHLDVYKRQ